MIEIIKQNTLIWLVFLLGIIVTVISLLALYVTIFPVQVLKDWELKTEKNEYVLGEIIQIKSTAYKKYDMEGVSTRELVCDTAKYNLSEIRSTRTSKGPLNTTVEAYVPAIIDNIPRKCKVIFDVKYSIYGFRAHGETNEFLVKEK